MGKRKLASVWAPALGIVTAVAVAGDVRAQDASVQAEGEPSLPDPQIRPLAIDFSDDPVLTLGDVKADPGTFRAIIVSALEESPVDREATALENAAEARIGEARAGYLPTIDVGFSAYTTLERNFSNDPFNVIERSRPRERVDFNFSVAQPLIDFGRTQGQVRSATARLRAAGFDREARVGNVAGEMVIAWTQVFGFQALERLLEGFVEAQDTLDAGIERRIEQGVSAEGDRVRVASVRSQAEVQLAQVRRELASAEARFTELSGIAPPDRLLRPPLLDSTRYSLEYAMLAAETAPQVQGAEAVAEAREWDVMTAEANALPTISASVNHARYGLYETGRDDYDTRATLNFNWRILGGGVWSRARAAKYDAEAADAVADRIREEARRDASIAWSDVQAIEQQVRALEDAYKAARQTRDIVVVRFGALRGTLFDVADAQNAYLRAASAYIRALTELDQARYILLLRTGRLLDVLEIEEEEVPL